MARIDQKAHYYGLKERGICVRCEKTRSMEGRVFSFPCAQKFHLKRNVERRARYLELRIRAIFKLGNCCAWCEFADMRALQIDHIHGGGVRGQKTLSAIKMLELILEMPDPSVKYQLLCANCNWIKRCENGEYNWKGRYG